MDIANKQSVEGERFVLKAAGYDAYKRAEAEKQNLANIDQRVAQLDLIMNLFEQAEKKAAEQKTAEAAKPAEAAEPAK